MYCFEDKKKTFLKYQCFIDNRHQTRNLKADNKENIGDDKILRTSSRDPNMAAPPTPRLPAVVKVRLFELPTMSTIPGILGFLPAVVKVSFELPTMFTISGISGFLVFSQVAGAAACLVTILYFTYLLRYKCISAQVQMYWSNWKQFMH